MTAASGPTAAGKGGSGGGRTRGKQAFGNLTWGGGGEREGVLEAKDFMLGDGFLYRIICR